MRLMVLLAALIGLVVACGQANEAEAPSVEGIQVGAHWTVTVTDPDGTVARVHEFDNAFDNDWGSALLTTLLAGGNSVAAHSIRVYRPGGEWYCAEAAGMQGGAAAAKAAASFNSVTAVATRDITVIGTPLMQSGVCTVAGLSGASHVSKVVSGFILTSPSTYCWEYQGSTKCHESTAAALTAHVEYIPVANGQILAFNIVFSFE